MRESLSYTANVKDYLCAKTALEVGLGGVLEEEINIPSKCCALAFFYGVTFFSRKLDRDTMTLSIENEGLLEICTYIMIHYFLATPDVRRVQKNGRERFQVTFARELVGRDLFERLNDEKKDLSFALTCEKCLAFFIRGVFLSLGNISDPQNEYRVEFIFRERESALSFASIMPESVCPKISQRRTSYVLYIKGNERVEELCALMGAEIVTLDIIEKSIEKETMNALNRSCNCETANIKKTVNASVNIRNAIRVLKESGRFDALPDELKETARLREEYPEASLTQLASMLEGGISRSGINHRLKKIIELSKE